MKFTVWTVTTCIPENVEPLRPDVFGSYDEAVGHIEYMMREEWKINAPEDDCGNPLPYPGDWRAAQEAIIENDIGEEWGRYILSQHDVELPT